MANPRYSQPPQRGGDNKVAQLAALAQLFSSMQRPGLEAQGQNKQAAMTLLGLMQQAEHQKAVLGEQQANRQGDQTYRADMLKETQAQRQQQADLAKAAEAQRAMELGITQGNQAAQLAVQNTGRQAELAQQSDLAQRAEAARMALLEKEIAARAEQEKLAGSRAVLMQLPGMPEMTTQRYLDTAAKMGVPGADAAFQAGRDSIVANEVKQLQSVLGPIYSQFKDKPQQAQKALDGQWAMEPRLRTPENLAVLQSWLDSQNAQVPVGGTAAPGAVPVGSAPKNLGAATGNLLGHMGYGILDAPAQAYNYGLAPALNFLGGMFGIPGEIPRVSTVTEALKATGVLAPNY